MPDGPGQYEDVDRSTYGLPKVTSINSRGVEIPTCYVTFGCPKCQFKAVLDAYRGAPRCIGEGPHHPPTNMEPIALFRGPND